MDYKIDEYYSTDEGRKLARELISNIIRNEPETNYDECIVAFISEFCDVLNIGKSKKNELPISCIVIAEVKSNIHKTELHKHRHIVQINGD